MISQDTKLCQKCLHSLWMCAEAEQAYGSIHERSALLGASSRWADWIQEDSTYAVHKEAASLHIGH